MTLVINHNTLSHKARIKGHSSGRQPNIARNKARHSEGIGLRDSERGMVAWPANPARRRGPGARVLVLAVEKRLESKAAGPGRPARGADRAGQGGLHDDGPGILLPGPSQVGVGVGGDGAVVDGDARVLVGARAALRCDEVVAAAGPRRDAAALEDGRGVAEDEVDGAGDVGLPVELALGVGVEAVLVALDGAFVHHRAVRADPQRHGLVLVWAGAVLERYVSRDKTVSHRACKNLLWF